MVNYIYSGLRKYRKQGKCFRRFQPSAPCGQYKYETGAHAPKFSVDAKGDQIISFNQGKTWQLPSQGPIDRSVSNVVIGWVKVTE